MEEEEEIKSRQETDGQEEEEINGENIETDER